MKIATWNVRGITRKTEELQTELLKRKIDIAIITETKKKNKGPEDTGNYIMISYTLLLIFCLCAEQTGNVRIT